MISEEYTHFFRKDRCIFEKKASSFNAAIIRFTMIHMETLYFGMLNGWHWMYASVGMHCNRHSRTWYNISTERWYVLLNTLLNYREKISYRGASSEIWHVV